MTAAAREPVARRAHALAPPSAFVALLALAAALVQAATFPVWPLALCMAIAAAAVLTAWRPLAALTIVPAALPLADFAPWSGRTLWDEFDLLQLAVLPLAWWRSRGTRAAPVPAGTRALFGVWFASLAISLWRGGVPWAWPDAASWSGLSGPWEAFRIGKGALWAIAFIAVALRVQGEDGARLAAIVRGVIVGLAGTVAVVIWERIAFVGLFDFEADYRVTGPFSSMNAGGASIECFLALGLIAALATLLRLRGWTARAGLLALVLGTAYALLVTYSRNGWFAALAGIGVLIAGLTRQHTLPRRARWAAAVGLLALVAGSLPVLMGGFAQQRLARIGEDWAIRAAHWRDALALRDTDAMTAIFGAGLGRFPTLHRQRSAEPARAGTVEVQDDPAIGRFLRLGAGTAVYVEQFVDVQAGQRLELAASVRGSAGAELAVALCEKWLLTSLQCARIEPVDSVAHGEWRRQRWRVDTGPWSEAATWRTAKLSVFHAGGGTLDVARIQLASDRPLLENGDFAHGMDHWFHSTDVDPPWHIHSLAVALLFGQGWLGVLIGSAVLAVAAWRTGAAAWRGDAVAAGMLSALIAACVSGLVNSLFDDPRLLGSISVLVMLAVGLCPNGAFAGRPHHRA